MSVLANRDSLSPGKCSGDACFQKAETHMRLENLENSLSEMFSSTGCIPGSAEMYISQQQQTEQAPRKNEINYHIQADVCQEVLKQPSHCCEETDSSAVKHR